MKKAIILAIALFPVFALGQNDSSKTAPATQTGKTQATVTITAKAGDVRGIIVDLFSQAKQNFVLQPGIQAALYLSLDKVEFEEALNIICTQAKLEFQVQNGIYFISKAKPVVIAPVIPVATGTLDKSVLAHRLTTKFAKTDIRVVLAEFGKQTDVKIEVDKSVKNYKLDAVLNHTTLRYALDKVTEATGLKFKFTDTLSILIYKPDDGNKVAVSGG
jgi:type II secretory pathway component GspD/PulD (secretin)